MFHDINNLSDIDDFIKTNEIILLKFDNNESKYDQYIYKLDIKIINITDNEIISFYDIDILPTVLVYKNNNLIESIKGYHSKTEFIKKILNIIQN